MFISVVIPNYNGAQLIRKNLPKVVEALEAFEKIEKQKWEIIVVDDNSSDNSIEVLEKFKNNRDELRYFKNNKNYGFSTTVNNGAKNSKGKFLLLLNSDVSPELGFVKPLIDNFSDKEAFAVGCLDKSVEGDGIVERGRGKGKWTRGFLVHSAAEVKKAPSLWVSGGSGMFRKEIWDKLGGLSEIYNPFYWEDIDLSYRAIKSGYKVLFEPSSIVIHDHEKGAIKTKYNQSKINRISYRNQIIFVWQNADLSNLLKNFAWLPYHFFKTMIKGDLEFVRAFIAAIFLVPSVIIKRKDAFRLFVKTDEEVVSIAK